MDQILEKVNQLTQMEIEEYRKNLMPSTAASPLHIKYGKGIWLYDVKGNGYMDLTAQFFTNYIGFGNEEIAEVVAEQAKMITYLGQYTHSNLRFALAHKIASIAPDNLNRVAFSTGGGPANELALKIALKNREGSMNFISLWDAYHGNTFSTLAATLTSSLHPCTTPPASWHGKHNPTWSFLTNIGNHFVRVPNPYCYRCPFNQQCESCDLTCARMLEMTIQKGVLGPVAGLILEPIQSGGGQIPLPQKYLKRVRKICDEYGIILIFDEVQTYAKTGKFFASEYYGVEPDIITTGKGIGGGFSLAAIIIHDRLKGFETVTEDLNTFTNNQVTMAASLKSIEIIERDHLLDNAAKMGRYLELGFTKMQKEFPEIGDIRAVGLAIGVELVVDPKTKVPLSYETTKKITDAAFTRGIIAQIARENVIKVKPALIINKEEADTVLGVFEECFREVLRA